MSSYIYTEKDRHFFEVPAEELAPWLIGKVLCRKISENEILRYRILETEAYPCDDNACHSKKYKTGNGVITQKMIGGTIYVHYRNNKSPGSSFDIVSNHEGIGEGVLIRGGININNPHERYGSKPILLGEALKIDYEKLNQADILNSDKIWLENDDYCILENDIKIQKRVGLDSVKDLPDYDKKRLLRFTLNRTI